jgi:DNA-binding transcriptional MerR regulator
MTDPLNDLHNYPDTMKISQLMKFFEKKGIGITRAMIQNYVRDGLLPPPVNKRIYTHKHLAALVTIDRLKSVFDIPMIKAVLSPYLDDEGLELDVYADFMQKTETLTRGWLSQVHGGTLLTMLCASELKSIIANE